MFNFEGKIWRTLPMLAWRPGELTRRYIAGERARFVSPVALFLFTVFLMFAVLNFTGALEPPTIRDASSASCGERSRGRRRPGPSCEAKRDDAVGAARRPATIDRENRQAQEELDH